MRHLLTFFAAVISASLSAAGERPLFRDFVGLCGHTVQFKPALYAPVCRWVRDYHPVQWDLDKDTAVLPKWPEAKNRVSWEQVYGSWQKAGLHTNVSLMIDGMQKDWKDMPQEARAYAGPLRSNSARVANIPSSSPSRSATSPASTTTPLIALSSNPWPAASARGIRK